LGFAYSRTDRNPEAAVYLSKAVKLEPANVVYRAYRGFACVEIRQYAMAEEDYKIVLKKFPEDYIALYNLGRAQHGQQKYEEAIASFNTVLKLQPNYLDAHFFIGLASASKNDFPNALTAFDNAIKANSQKGIYYFNRGKAKGMLNRTDYCADFKKALELGYTEAQKMLQNFCK